MLRGRSTINNRLSQVELPHRGSGVADKNSRGSAGHYSKSAGANCFANRGEVLICSEGLIVSVNVGRVNCRGFGLRPARPR